MCATSEPTPILTLFISKRPSGHVGDACRLVPLAGIKFFVGKGGLLARVYSLEGRMVAARRVADIGILPK